MTRSWRTSVAGLVLTFIMAGLARDSSAQMSVPTGRGTLRGLPGVEIQVEELQPEIERAGLTRATIASDIEGRLRARGIAVYASQRANPSPAKPYLYVHLNALPLPRGAGLAVAVQLQLRQALHSLIADAIVVDAMTWDVHNVIGVPESGIQQVRAEVRSYVDQFIDDWIAVH